MWWQETRLFSRTGRFPNRQKKPGFFPIRNRWMKDAEHSFVFMLVFHLTLHPHSDKWDLSIGQKVGKGEKPGFFPNWPTSQLQEKAGFLFTITFFVLYTEVEYETGVFISWESPNSLETHFGMDPQSSLRDWTDCACPTPAMNCRAIFKSPSGTIPPTCTFTFSFTCTFKASLNPL